MTISLIARFVVVAFLCAVPLVQHNSYWLHVLSLALIGAVLAMGLQLLVGMAGVLSLGQGAFYGIGAYTTAILPYRGKRLSFAPSCAAASWPRWPACSLFRSCA